MRGDISHHPDGGRMRMEGADAHCGWGMEGEGGGGSMRGRALPR